MTAEPIDGIVKYQASHAMGDVETYLRTLPAGIRETALDALALFSELDAARTTLHDAGLIGVYPSGIGYGNISLRLAGNLFLISGSGTGSSRFWENKVTASSTRLIPSKIPWHPSAPSKPLRSP